MQLPHASEPRTKGHSLGGSVATRMERDLDGPGEPVERHTVYAGMVFGMVLLLSMQALGTVVANAIWNRRIGGA